MTSHDDQRLVEEELKKSGGVLRLIPTWVTRAFLVPGRRLKLDPRDYYAYGGAKGGIDERWLASTTEADNGELTAPDEGLSFAVIETPGGPRRIKFKDIIDFMGAQVIGEAQMNKYGRLMTFAKFFDNQGPIGHHVHPADDFVKPLGLLGKPEAYYFPPQLNNVPQNFPHTFFGLNPDVTRDQVIACLKAWAERGDNNILDLSRAFRLELGTGWNVPPGVLHAPGSLLTYEPQRASDAALFFQSQVEGRTADLSALLKYVPPDKRGDYDFIVSVLDWEKNVDPHFREHYFLRPVPVAEEGLMAEKGFRETWVVYGTDLFCAKELTVRPGRRVTLTDAGSYGLIMVQGYGRLNQVPIETPAMIRFGQLTRDEMFVTEDAARQGVVIENHSDCEDLVMLKHFGPDNPEAAGLIRPF